jgi:hypothetical protein
MSNSSRPRRQSVAVVSGGGSSQQTTQSTIRDAATLSSAISTLKNENILLKFDRPLSPRPLPRAPSRAITTHLARFLPICVPLPAALASKHILRIATNK